MFLSVGLCSSVLFCLFPLKKIWGVGYLCGSHSFPAAPILWYAQQNWPSELILDSRGKRAQENLCPLQLQHCSQFGLLFAQFFPLEFCTLIVYSWAEVFLELPVRLLWRKQTAVAIQGRALGFWITMSERCRISPDIGLLRETRSHWVSLCP